MSSFAQTRRAVLLRRRLVGAATFAPVVVVSLLFAAAPSVFGVERQCYGWPRATTSPPVCAVAAGALWSSAISLPVGALFPSILLAWRWLRRRARRKSRWHVAPTAPDSGRIWSNGSRSVFRVRVPNARRRVAAWALALLPGVATWIVRNHFFAEVGDLFALQRALGGTAILFAWWLLEESRFRLRTLALLGPALLFEHWNALAWMLTQTGWSVFGFA